MAPLFRIALPTFAACGLAFLLSFRFHALESQSLGVPASIKMVFAGVQAGALLAFAFVCVRFPAGSKLWRPAGLAALALAAGALPWLHRYFDRPAEKALGLGGDRDDAMIDAVARLVAGIDPYLTPVYTGAPISPGPGWLLLNPFAGSPLGFASMLPVHALLFAILAARATGGWKAPAVTIAGCLASTAVWENAYGGDLAALGFALASLGVLCGYGSSSRGTFWLCAMLAGLLATARPPLMLLPVFTAIVFFWARGDRRGAIAIGGVGTFVALAVHAVFAFGFARDIAYQPAHLIGAGVRLFGYAGLTAAAACFAGAIWLLVRHAPRAADPLAIYAAGLLLTFAPISLATIVAAGYRLDGPIDWTGYTVVALPTLFYFAARRLEFDGIPTGR